MDTLVIKRIIAAVVALTDLLFGVGNDNRRSHAHADVSLAKGPKQYSARHRRACLL